MQLTKIYHKFVVALGLISCFSVLRLWTTKDDVPDDFVDYGSCVWHMASKRLPALVASLSQNPEDGLAPKDLSSTMEHIKGLDPDVFRGKQIAMMGDSTLYYLTRQIYAIMMTLEKKGFDELKNTETMTLSEATSFLNQSSWDAGVWGRSRRRGKIKFASITRESIIFKTLSDGTHIEWMGIRGKNKKKHSGPKPEKSVEDMFTKVEEMKPQILVANMGLHWMHLCGTRNCPSNRGPGQGFLIKSWVNYKKDWLQRVYDMAVRVNTSLLLFKTMNFMCHEKKMDPWGTVSSQYLSFDKKTIEDCYQTTMIFSDSDNIPKDQIYNYCKYGHTTEIGTEYLNHQIREFVREKNENRQSNSKLTVAIFEDHDVQGCYSTEGGIHHEGNMLLRIRLLTNTIESYSECSSLYT